MGKACLASALKTFSVLFTSLAYGLCGLQYKNPFLYSGLFQKSVKMDGATSLPGDSPLKQVLAELTIMVMLQLKQNQFLLPPYPQLFRGADSFCIPVRKYGINTERVLFSPSLMCMSV